MNYGTEKHASPPRDGRFKAVRNRDRGISREASGGIKMVLRIVMQAEVPKNPPVLSMRLAFTSCLRRETAKEVVCTLIQI